MYNLLVSGWEEEWQGAPCTFDLSRCVSQHEYTDQKIAERFGKLDGTALTELTRLPTIFAYEDACQLDPKFGLIREVTVRRGQVRIEYEFIPVQPFLTAADFDVLAFELDIGKWEMNRTHWAIKDVNLPKELHAARGIVLPSWTRQASRAVDITQHHFDVGLSFPGEARGLVEQVARELEARLGPNAYFYDNNYVSQLARPSLDTLLQDIYRNRSKLIVVFIGADYQRKDWCGVEFRAIREIIMARDEQRIMYVRVDDGSVDGVLRTDGYVDARRFKPADIAQFITERLALIP
ncbi:MAG: TIR domain-containing protein [Mesorhizobium sp.]|uniref:toll/interleukin-1 receptor domain-containing protein n=1 Tax=unclassified Mesorhizobium TaxID=325217 RepID=UPI000F753DCA|nr:MULTISPECIES: TIR domain-containing protein [unclassified Mesorhizobium]RVC81964.1 TIR domain-containing protein [Mesorhizobium sp. M2A.F.Ca.ET.046.02.1.1]AZO39318.1 TIR domain-containing protein [Mesorhizobium sp. M2A.F.Ca.ET.046.03.2.1]AZO75830.1 TIR domain-containing protein [Mesorhizobium sp. M1D.F.Ca.ET.043.01.1.1]RWB50128.1 MAG: TIR domain-containing protein [Mesorhizobium sp.]RWE22508.1 MAG: TIR domain-containing protein [Mesorhizobium sp.]